MLQDPRVELGWIGRCGSPRTKYSIRSRLGAAASVLVPLPPRCDLGSGYHAIFLYLSYPILKKNKENKKKKKSSLLWYFPACSL